MGAAVFRGLYAEGRVIPAALGFTGKGFRMFKVFLKAWSKNNRSGFSQGSHNHQTKLKQRHLKNGRRLKYV